MARWLAKWKKAGPEAWFLWGQAALLVLLCAVHALEAGRYADFYPINGTFQNYNPVRRLLSGQVPYADFQDYLGLGHLFAGALATALLGGSYRASLLAFSLLTFAALILLCLVLGRAILRRWGLVLASVNALLVLILVQPGIFTHVLCWSEDIRQALGYALSTGNSARFVRGMVLPLSCLLYGAGARLLGKSLEKWPRLHARRSLISLCLMGALGGFAFLWSNDYGICTWLCLAIMTFLVAWRRSGRFTKALLGLLVDLAATALTIAVLAGVLTLGHWGQWLRGTFGAGGYQGWYFNTPEKSFYLFNVDFSFPMMVQALVCVAYLVKMLWDKAGPEAVRRWGIPAFVNMAGFAAVNAYKLLSSGDAKEVALSALFATLLFEGLRLAGQWTAAIQGKARPAHLAVLVMGLAWVVSAGKDAAIGWAAAGGAGAYIPAMGGVVTCYQDDLREASEFLQGEDFFSTYASAQELVEGKFQPSGTDYIIHALGDRQREDYLRAFTQGDFTYAATIREDFDPWATWETRADWYFYRELYAGWHPVFANSYEMYWERGGAGALPNPPEVQVVDVDAATKKLVIQTDSHVNGIADVYVDYAIEKAPGLLSAAAFQPMVLVQNTGTSLVDPSAYQDGDVPPLFFDSHYLRPQGREPIPILVVGGYGETTLTANPDRCCSLRIGEGSCGALYTGAFDYVKAEDVVQEEPPVVRVQSNEKNRQCLEGAAFVELQGERYGIAGRWEGEGYFWLTLDGGGLTSEALKQGNMLHIVRG